MAVCKVSTSVVVNKEGVPEREGINDLRMGTVDKTLACETCKCNFTDCPGHPGYIELAKPMYHVGFVEVCRKILRCICFNCSKLLTPKDKKYKEIMKVKSNKKRQALMFNLCKSVKVCKINPKEHVNKYFIYFKRMMTLPKMRQILSNQLSMMAVDMFNPCIKKIKMIP